MATILDFEDIERNEDDPSFMVDVDGFEGPLDLLLTLARKQKVDLTCVSILALSEQYLSFIEAARSLRLELAADYLVMAAWLAYLKSRLLLPKLPTDNQPSGEELAEDLAARLKHLDSIRLAGASLTNRLQLGRDVFARGAPEALKIVTKPVWQATLYDLISAYAQQRQRLTKSHYALEKRAVCSLSDARQALERLLGKTLDWTPIDAFLLNYGANPKDRRSVRASSFAACLELAREGHVDLRQDLAYAPIYFRNRSDTQDLGT